MGTGGSGSNVGNTYGLHDDGSVVGGHDNVESSGGGGNTFPSNNSQIQHMFGKREGHLPDTPANRKTIEELANDESCKLGTDTWGNAWYARLNDDGTQTWVSVRDGVIQNYGENAEPLPFNATTGLSASSKPKNNGFGRKRG